MKILTGALRGQPIQFTKNPHLRPTADKVRKALFDMLQAHIEGKRTLDLFAGTGALGLEALSMGASKATFVELDKTQCKKIRENLQRLKLDERAEVLNADALTAIESFSRQGRSFDIILIDPPYEKGLGLKAMAALNASSLIGSGCVVIFECSKRETAPETVGQLQNIKEKVYGDTRVAVYRFAADLNPRKTFC